MNHDLHMGTYAVCSICDVSGFYSFLDGMS
jgi:hypothetical protein